MRRVLLVVGLVVGLAGSAKADEPAPQGSPQAAALAEGLFVEGRQLAARGEHAAACPKFEQAYKLDRTATGTLLNLALCNEQIGKLASAWGQFREVASRSRGHVKREKMADEHASALEPRLSRLTLEVTAEARAAHPTLRVDGIVLDEPAWSTDLPVDGGKHTIEVSAEGKLPRTLEVDVAPERARVTTRIEGLEDPPRPSPEPAIPLPLTPPTRAVPDTTIAAPLPRRTEPSGRRTTGVVVATGGVVALGIGTAFGIAALSARADARSCGSPCIAGSDAARQSDASFDSANTLGWVANIAIGTGAVLAATGLYLWLTAPSAPRAAPRLSLGW